MAQNQRIAQPGDVFILLVPMEQDLHRLCQQQAELHGRYGGQTVGHIHITCQRFTLRQGQSIGTCLGNLKEEIEALKTFPIYTDGLIQFHAPYWQTYVLRWRVQETPAWEAFREYLDQVLEKSGCPSHFSRQRRSTCSILTLEQKINLDGFDLNSRFPFQLFTAQKVVISQLQNKNHFATIETIALEA